MRTAVRVFLIFLLCLAGLAAGFVWWAWNSYTEAGPSPGPVTVIIEKGSSLRGVARQLESAGIITDARIFVFGAYYDDLATKLRAGEFQFSARVSMRGAAEHIARGDTVRRRLTVPEGLTVTQIVELVKQAPGLVDQPEIPEISEGSLFPETYFYSWGDSRRELISRMRQKMTRTVSDIWNRRSADAQLKTPEELIVLASIIEKETGLKSERSRVSAVFHNRLRRGMRLQSDPTVVYGLTKGMRTLGRPLTRKDLKTPSPYNTYLIKGLPPGPIASPGEPALRAAANPGPFDDLYFVADGSGGHVFAKTLAEHNRNVARWRKIQRRRKP